MGSAVLAVSLGAGGCGSPAATTKPAPSPTQSVTPTPTPTPAPTPPPTSSPTTDGDTASEKGAVIEADRAFWQDYADDDAEGACSSAFGYAHQQVVSMAGAFLTECTTFLGARSSAGTSLTLGDPVVYGGVIALVAPSGRVCGGESLTPGDCLDLPDLSQEMPASASTADFGAALVGILTGWSELKEGWTPDVLVKVDDAWHPLLPLADPVNVLPDPPLDGVDPPADPQPKRPWTDQDWNDTCASGGCGAVPGLPPFVPGGGLSFGGS